MPEVPLIRFRKLALSGCVLLMISYAAAFGQATPQGVSITADNLAPGTTIDLTGQWLFKPTYALGEGEKPETSTESSGYNPVPVPQMLSRIQWWLDDSEDFKKWEQERLDKLGFDTEKSDDGWYRLDLDIPQLPKDRHLWIEFDGVAMRSRTFINGNQLGAHDGMFSRFAYDLTPHLKPGKNALAVWVGMEKIPPTSGNLGQAVTVNLSAAKVISMSKGMFGPLTPNQDNRAYDLYGIWQPVKLVVRGAARIEDVWFQPSLDGGKARVTATAVDPNALVRMTWTDTKTGAMLTTQNGPLRFEDDAPAAKTFGFTNAKPKLWTPSEPNLYRLDVTIEAPAGEVLDKWSQNVGFRTFEVKGNQFFLNGKRYWLRGANQLPYGKNPWDRELPRKLIQMLHDANVNSTRTHCTPWNEAWLSAADEIGLAVSIEGIRPWALAGRSDQIGHEIMPPPEIVKHWLMENEDVVRRCRNHPSVFLFTVGNEMLLRDAKNLKKWQIMSDVGKQTKRLAPDHPVVISSDYVRDEEFYNASLKPADLYDGDVDDMHKYSGWYSDSPFVVDTSTMKKTDRPLIGQEMSSGYPDLDTGLPVLRYTRDLVTPQAWVGVYAYPGNDPAIFLSEHAKVTKKWAEQLRYERGDKTAGFSLFSSECWFRHSYLPEATPYPVLDAVKQAFAPVGLALETNQRRFYAGDEIATNLLVTNDEQGRSFENLTVQVGFIHSHGRSSNFIDAGPQAKLDKLEYYQTAKLPLRIRIPTDLPDERTRLPLIVRLVTSDRLISTTTDPVEIFVKPPAPPALPDTVIVVKPGHSLDDLKEGASIRQKIESGATAVVFSPSKDILKLFPDDLLDVRGSAEKPDYAEFADWYPARGTKLAENLKPMDIKWWARKGDWRAYVAGTSHRLKPGGKARELIRFIPSHSYIDAKKVPEQYRVVLSEIPLGKGRLWICDLDLAASSEIDPAARLVADNLYRAAADPESTKTLQPVPSHEVLLKGMNAK